jgi:hypothetical protein
VKIRTSPAKIFWRIRCFLWILRFFFNPEESRLILAGWIDTGMRLDTDVRSGSAEYSILVQIIGFGIRVLVCDDKVDIRHSLVELYRMVAAVLGNIIAGPNPLRFMLLADPGAKWAFQR